MPLHDTFISYTEEDNDFATEIAFMLKANGLSTWFAPLSLKVGDKLLDSIEKGLSESKSGILVISKAYLSKGWTTYEMDILIRQHIEEKKKILPIWLNVNKQDVDNHHIGLGGIFSITDTNFMPSVISKLVQALSDNAPSRGIIPIWEDPAYRFLIGLGEVNLETDQGPTTTIFELLMHGKDSQFPFWLAGRVYSKNELIFQIAQLIGPDPERVKNRVGEVGYNKLLNLCIEHNLHPNKFY